MKLYRYVGRRFIWSLLKTQVIIIGIILLFDTVDLLQQFKGIAGTGAILGLAAMRLPAIVSQTFPLVVLIASLWTFLALARSSELVISRAAGVSGLKLITLPLLLSFLLGVFAFSAMNPIVSATKLREAQIRENLGSNVETKLSLSGQNIWLRQSSESGQMVLQASRAEQDGSALHDVRMFDFDGLGRIVSRTEASVAVLQKGAWHLTDARRWQFPENTSPEKESFAALIVPTNLTSSQLLNSFASPETIPFWDLRSYIARIEDSGFSGVRHRLFFQTELVRPLVFVAMTLIGAAFSMRPVRFGLISLLVLSAILAGFSFYFVLDVASSFGAARQVPILVAAWAPPLAAIMLALALLLHFEDG